MSLSNWNLQIQVFVWAYNPKEAAPHSHATCCVLSTSSEQGEVLIQTLDLTILPLLAVQRDQILVGGCEWRNLSLEEVDRLSMVRGFENRTGSNNCFLNVVIQCLWHTRPFREAFLKLSPQVGLHLYPPYQLFNSYISRWCCQVLCSLAFNALNDFRRHLVLL